MPPQSHRINNIYPLPQYLTMFKPVYEKVRKEISGEIAFNHVAEISTHHRIQASPGLRDAVNYAVDALKGYGLQAKVHAYPANGRDYSWSSLMFKEWSCDDAQLTLIQPEKEAQFLARYDAAKLSVIQRSTPTPKGGVEAEVVVLENGEEDKDYKGKEVEGRMVLTDGDAQRVHEMAVERRGALGIIYYGTWVREPDLPEGELDDALKYTSFWWAGDEAPGFGFVLTPRKGRWLKKLVEKSKEPVTVHAVVDSGLYEGSIENAVATIPGETKEEVVVIAHICHPQPSCNDNASGTAAAMEAARALQALISSGKLPKPRRTIRFTLVPEMAGSYAYLAEREKDIPGMVAALNLDMVGERQDVCGGPLIVERTPEAAPSYVNALMEAIYDEVKVEAKNLGGSASYALFKHAVTPFSGGSDHYVYSDPTVGVPCPMVIQWPDKFWHTSYDTLDKVDPEMLRKVALMTATYAYSIANAGPWDAVWLANEVATKEKGALIEKTQAEVTLAIGDAENLEKTLAATLKSLKEKTGYRVGRCVEAVKSVKRLAPGDPTVEKTVEALVSDIKATGKTQRQLARKAIKDYAETAGISPLPRAPQRRLKKLEREAAGIIPRRLYRGPVSIRPWLRKMTQEERDAFRKLGKDHPEGRSLGTLAMYWTDGERSLHEISRLVELEAGKTDIEYLLGYIRFLVKMGLVGL